MFMFRNLALFSLIFTLSAAPSHALSHMDLPDLFKKADLVVLGEVVSADQEVQSTEAQIRILQAFKGEAPAGSLVNVSSQGGKVFINEDEPVFLTLRVNLLFLQKAPAGYVCVNQADGQKQVRGDNIYPYHDNSAFSMPVKDYLKALEELAKAKGLPKAVPAED